MNLQKKTNRAKYFTATGNKIQYKMKFIIIIYNQGYVTNEETAKLNIQLQYNQKMLIKNPKVL